MTPRLAATPSHPRKEARSQSKREGRAHKGAPFHWGISMTNRELERLAIMEAYQAHVAGLFKVLVAGIAGANDAEIDACMDRFHAGLELGRLAKELIGDLDNGDD